MASNVLAALKLKCKIDDYKLRHTQPTITTNNINEVGDLI
jgi:hypothetical protein